MPRVSKYQLSPKEITELSRHFSSLLSSLHNEDQIRSFIEEFFTFEEKNMLTKRLALFMMLKQGFKSSVIRSALNFSKETVRIYNQQLPLKSEIFHKTISSLLRNKKIKEFISKTEKVIGTILTAKTNMKSRAKLLDPF